MRSRKYLSLLLPVGMFCLSACVESKPLFDQDADGFSAWNDCDDQDSAVGPRYKDIDADGHGSGSWDAGCADLTAAGFVTIGDDCNDQNALTFPGAAEVCDGTDNDCDAVIDEDLELITSFRDHDGDGKGDADDTKSLCSIPDGYTTDSSDCDDLDADIAPGVKELTCNGIDEDCDGLNDDHPDSDRDGFDLCGEDVSKADDEIADCDDTDNDIHAGAAEIVGDALDSNCNGYTDGIETVVGNGMCCFYGDGEDASHAIIGTPEQMVADSKGNLYFADSSANRVRKVSSSGVITTVAGTGAAGYDGDGNLAIDAVLNSPYGVALDAQGNLYVSDTGNHCIRKVTAADGKIATFAGQCTKAGNSGDGGTATAAQLLVPLGITLNESGGLFVADSGNHRVRVVLSGVISAVAGTGDQGFSGDGGPAADAKLNAPGMVMVEGRNTLLIADTGNHAVRRVDNIGLIRTIAGNAALSDPETGGYGGDGSPSENSFLSFPTGMVLDANGNLFIADSGNNRVRMISSGYIATVAGSGAEGYSGDRGPALEAELNFPFGLAVDPDGFLWVADEQNHRIRKVLW